MTSSFDSLDYAFPGLFACSSLAQPICRFPIFLIADSDWPDTSACLKNGDKS